MGDFGSRGTIDAPPWSFEMIKAVIATLHLAIAGWRHNGQVLKWWRNIWVSSIGLLQRASPDTSSLLMAGGGWHWWVEGFVHWEISLM